MANAHDDATASATRSIQLESELGEFFTASLLLGFCGLVCHLNLQMIL